ncbi:hypothetical protein BH10ACT3_BH10ACT3_24240 [soil metagenome]
MSSIAHPSIAHSSIAHRLFAFLALILLVTSHALSSPPHDRARLGPTTLVSYASHGGTGESGPSFGPDIGTCEHRHDGGHITK